MPNFTFLQYKQQKKYAFIHGGCDMTNFIEEPSDQILMFDVAGLCSEMENLNQNFFNLNK